MEKALQWWYARKLRQLESEANLIKEQLLQESFAMRRSLELSSDKLGFCTASHQKYLKRLESFHSSLKQLGDRLYPSSLNEGLPYAIEQSSQQWQQLFGYQFQLNLTQNWVSVTPMVDFIILSILEDLLRIQVEKTLSNNLVFIDLEQNVFDGKTNNRLKVVLAAEDTLSNDRELEYLQQMFESLTSGTCKSIVMENSNIWLFKW